MARPKGSRSLASRLMAGVVKSGGIYEEAPDGKQVYLHALWKIRSAGTGTLSVHYVGCGRPGRSQQVEERPDNPQHRAWLLRYWVPRTVLFAKPRRLESIAWLNEMLSEYGCAEGLVIIETPFLKRAARVEAKLIELYRALAPGHFNLRHGTKPINTFQANPNYGCLKEHATNIRLRSASGEATNALAREFGVDPSSIRDILKGKSYKSEDEPIE